jgi:hypothetical protein
MDVDLIIGLDPVNAGKAVAVLKALGYQPRAPVPLADFADAGKRRAWMAEQPRDIMDIEKLMVLHPEMT